MIANPLSDFSAPDFDCVVIYWCGWYVRAELRAVLDAIEMAARGGGEPFEWRERKGWFESTFTVRAVPDRHETIKRWGRENAEWDA